MIRRLIVIVGAALVGAYVGRQFIEPVIIYMELEPPLPPSDADHYDVESITDDYPCPHCGEPVTVSVGYSEGERSQITATWGCGHRLALVGKVVCMEDHGD